MFPVDRIVLPLLNHLLGTAAWARARLRPCQGLQALVQAGFVDLKLEVTPEGLFRTASGDATVDVTITLPGDFAVLFIVDRKRVFQTARISGSADFAEALAFVFRNLSWDVEAELAGVIGDIPARRLDQLRRGMQSQATDSLRRTAENIAEYISEDSDFVVPKREIERFSSEVNRLRDDCARLEKRLGKL